MDHVFSFPVVKEIRAASPPAPSSQARTQRPRTTQRSLVQASLLRCPDADRSAQRQS